MATKLISGRQKAARVFIAFSAIDKNLNGVHLKSSLLSYKISGACVGSFFECIF